MANTRLFIGLRPEPATEDDETFMRRLRAFLKAALRAYRIRCTTIIISKPSGDELPVDEREVDHG